MENKNRRITSVAGTTEKVPGLGSRKKAPPWQRESIRYTYKQKHLFCFSQPRTMCTLDKNSRTEN